MLNLFEKLINEHGSSTILKERITAIKEEYTRLESKNNTFQIELDSLKSLLSDKELIITNLQKELTEVRGVVFCDHCDSPKTNKIGVRNDPSMKLIKLKQFMYKCTNCNKISYISEKN